MSALILQAENHCRLCALGTQQAEVVWRSTGPAMAGDSPRPLKGNLPGSNLGLRKKSSWFGSHHRPVIRPWNEPTTERFLQSIRAVRLTDPGNAGIGTDQHRRPCVDGDATYPPGRGCNEFGKLPLG